MSDLRPVGVTVEVEGVERHFLFTLNVIDEIQEHFKMELSQVIDNMTDKEKANDTVRYLVSALLNDEAEREASKGKELRKYTEREAGWLISLENISDIILAIFKAYGLSLPEPDEDDYPNMESGQTEEST